MPDQPLTRRERQREQTTAEILTAARHLLAADGPAALTLRATAREVGMTAPGVCRYFPDHRALVQAVVADLYRDLAADLEAARDAHADAPTADRLAAAARALRRWSLAHRSEFTLLFGKPIADAGTAPEDPAHDAGWRFGQVFLGLMTQLWREGTVPPPAADESVPAWWTQYDDLREHLTDDIPLPVLNRFVQAWTRIYGLVALEVFGHLDFTLADPEPFFEQALSDVLTSRRATPAAAVSAVESGKWTVPTTAAQAAPVS
ncbi:TetR/AcrR family transcriptional regulator [Streptomyces kaniharaensis]|uniref:TetR/AcrR family transcriptional regulator n=1 Tax=Streptomyces kaniharaensis TaxID=212423 RepID=A0A6N7KZI3_9ACTN|nr:TetR/AcrR family transcriptional regulator [Streptomyces kaniharaensis]MQS17062.1 TetR/AcrR family transcriptional regulator [Streptomyces kaniharaensis]